MNHGNKILAVDDSTTNNVLLEAVLHAKGYDIITASSAKEAFAILHNENIDLILLDLLMPDVSGFDFLKEVKSKIHTKHIPVIIVSAANDSENVKITRELGAVGFIVKPIDINFFLDTIENCLNN